jgi:hypothetical protein
MEVNSNYPFTRNQAKKFIKSKSHKKRFQNLMTLKESRDRIGNVLHNMKDYGYDFLQTNKFS